MHLLRIKTPDYLPRASDYVDEAAAMIERLLELEIAYRHQGNIYFDPLKFPGFGKLYGLDMSRWPTRRRRFHRDTYPGIQWNLGDFILWHGYREGDTVYWDTAIGRGRPSWNIQDPSMVASHFQETLSIYCGGIDNLYRHHDYSIRHPRIAPALSHGPLLAARPPPPRRGQEDVQEPGDHPLHRRPPRPGVSPPPRSVFSSSTAITGKSSPISDKGMKSAAEKLRRFRERVREIARRADGSAPLEDDRARGIREAFRSHMDRGPGGA